MEAQRKSVARGPTLTPLAPEGDSLETVRALHQTVVALRLALEKSKAELQALRAKVQNHVDTKVYVDTIEKLSLENHILRQRVLADAQDGPEHAHCLCPEPVSPHPPTAVAATADHMETSRPNKDECVVSAAEGTESAIGPGEPNAGLALDSLTVPGPGGDRLGRRENILRSLSEDGDHSACSGASQPEQEASSSQGCKGGGNGDSDNDSEELDDIELIFTTDETKELGVMQEDLVSIEWQGANTPGAGSASALLKFADGPEPGAETEVEAGEAAERVSRVWMHSVLVETDISKCGVLEDTELEGIPGRLSRRNTMPMPLLYPPLLLQQPQPRAGPTAGTGIGTRPLAVKFAGAGGRSATSGPADYQKFPVRPILMERNSAKRESEAQTDITALPPHWKSESYLAQKVAHNFTTLPSKFALPVTTQAGLRGRHALRLTDKTQEARRTLLSDINFTSMVPELSRSADHLCPEEAMAAGGSMGAGSSSTGSATAAADSTPGSGLLRHFPRAFSYMKNADLGSVSPGYSGGVGLLAHADSREGWAPCNCPHLHSCGGPRYRGSLSCLGDSANGGGGGGGGAGRRRHSWRADGPAVSSPGPLPRTRTWGSVPSSPTHVCGGVGGGSSSGCWGSTPRAAGSGSGDWPGPGSGSGCGAVRLRPAPATRSARPRSRVTFEESAVVSGRRRVQPGRSLPDLRAGDWEPADSGDSTDSLIDEAEEFLRRSIDSMLAGGGGSVGDSWGRSAGRRARGPPPLRRLSQPDPLREVKPPRSAQPFLPRAVHDLRPEHLVKVIALDGRVLVGRVRYVGAVTSHSEPHIGLQLPRPIGNSDGCFEGQRYFDCETDYALFVPFKKVVMAWSV